MIINECAIQHISVPSFQRIVSVSHERQMVERTGGRFLHHDGGEDESLAKLDNTLAVADLLICQTGCISHNTYLRAKDACKTHQQRMR